MYGPLFCCLVTVPMLAFGMRGGWIGRQPDPDPDPDSNSDPNSDTHSSSIDNRWQIARGNSFGGSTCGGRSRRYSNE